MKGKREAREMEIKSPGCLDMLNKGWHRGRREEKKKRNKFKLIDYIIILYEFLSK